MDFNQNYFQIFQLPETFELDKAELSSRYLELQKRVHPDKFVDASDREKRLSMQWTTQINEAYATLGSPLSRAIYLLQLQGIEIADNPVLEPSFLMDQIELREELEEIETADGSLEVLDQFKSKLKILLNSQQQAFAGLFGQRAFDQAEQLVYKMQFMNKLVIAADHVEEKLLDY